MKSRNIALCGILLALSAGASTAESFIPLPLGVKPGFSNLPVMYSMAEMGGKYGLAICILKSVFVLLTRGVTAFFMSLAGGLFSYIIMLLLYKKTNASLILMSVIGAISHNFGQLFIASQLMKTSSVLICFPVMIISGCIAGIVTGLILKLLLDTMQKINQGGQQ